MADIRFLRRVCTRTFREQMLILHPALRAREDLRRLAAYFVWSRHRAESGALVVPVEVLRVCATSRAHRRDTGKLLEEFSMLVAPLELRGEVKGVNILTGEIVQRDYSFTDGKAREVVVHWPDATLNTIATEKERPVRERKDVHFVDGTQFTRRSRSKIVKEETMEAAKTTPKCAEAEELMDYLNTQATNSYADIEDRIDDVEAYIRRELSGLKREQQLSVLHSILETLRPTYKAVENTVRLYETTGGLTYIKREYRGMLTPNWVEFDLQASQLRIAAYTWGIPSLVELFEADQSPWPVFLAALGLDAGYKPFVKDLTYACAYGAGKAALLEVALQAAKDKAGDDVVAVDAQYARYSAIVERFLTLQWIADLMVAKNHKLGEITRKVKANEPIVSAVGEVIMTHNPLRVLVQLQQAIEFCIIYSAAQVAMDAKILRLWQHDGFSVVKLREQKLTKLERKMNAAVVQAGEAFGVKISLERKAA